MKPSQLLFLRKKIRFLALTLCLALVVSMAGSSFAFAGAEAVTVAFSVKDAVPYSGLVFLSSEIFVTSILFIRT